MIETTLCNHLKALNNKIPVFMEIPDHPPQRFFLLENTGGNRENQIQYNTFALQAYGVSVTDAAHMALLGTNQMLRAVEHDKVAAVKLNSGPYNFPDITRKRHRYQSVFEITHYELE